MDGEQLEAAPTEDQDALDLLLYEARTFGGLQMPIEDRIADAADVGPAGGIGVRLGGVLACASARTTRGPAPETELRLEYCASAQDLRVAAGLVWTRDSLGGEPLWLQGIGFDLDLDFSDADRPVYTEIFLSAAMSERFAPEWIPDRGVAMISDGLRVWRRSVGVEVRGEYRFAGDDRSVFGFYVGIVGRTGVGRPFVPLSRVRTTVEPTTPPAK